MWYHEIFYDESDVIGFLDGEELKPSNVTIVYNFCGSYVVFYFKEK